MRIPFTKFELRARRPSPDPWEDGWWYGTRDYESATGITVDEDKALRLSTVWACVKVIAEDLASLPLMVYRRKGESKARAQDHPLYRLIHDAPNNEMTALQFREALQAHLLTMGNAYAEIQRNLRGQLIALWPLNPAKMTVKRNEADQIVYEYYDQAGKKYLFGREDILHVAGLGYNGLIGYSPISYQREAIGVGLAAQDYQASTFVNGARPSMALVHPAPKAPDAEHRKAFREQLKKEYGGSGNAGKIAVFWEGMEPKPMSMSMEDAQFIEGRKFTRSEICAIFRVPPHKVMDLERATFSNIEQQGIDYVTGTIRPWAVRWEQAINQQLLGGTEEYFAEHLLDGLMRGDLKSRYDAYAVGRQWGWLSVNDIRSLENMNPIDEGDDYLVPMNMTVIGEEPPAPAEKTVEEKLPKRLTVKPSSGHLIYLPKETRK